MKKIKHEALYLMGESFCTAFPCAQIRPVALMEGFDVNSEIKCLKNKQIKMSSSMQLA